jgi:hypothetical protein
MPGYLMFMRGVLEGLAPVLADDAVLALVIGDVESEGGHTVRHASPLAEAVWRGAAEPAGYHLCGIAVDEVVASRKLTRVWGTEAGRATPRDRLLVIAPTEAGRRRALAGAALPIDWRWPPPN